MAAAVASANPHNVAIKRIMREYAELQATPSQEFVANPLDDNLFEWHFTIAGAQETDYAGGRYHGRILLPSQYPFKPPDIMMLTPSGRFETHKKICLSISSFHPKNWQPSWSIRTVLTALIAFFPSPPAGAIGSLDYSSAEKRSYAHRSGEWTCELCGKCNHDILPYTKQCPAPKDSTFTPAPGTTNNTQTLTPTPTSPQTTATTAQSAPVETPATATATATAPPPPALITTASQPNTNISSPKPSELTFSYAPATPAKSPAMSRTMSDPTTEIMPELEEKKAEATSAQAPLPASMPHAQPQQSVHPQPQPPSSPPPNPSATQHTMSHITVILAFLIIAILLRKLVGHINNRAAVFDLASDWELEP